MYRVPKKGDRKFHENNCLILQKAIGYREKITFERMNLMVERNEHRTALMNNHLYLSDYIEKTIEKDGVYQTQIPQLSFVRSSVPLQPIKQVHQPALCIIFKGKKVVRTEDKEYWYGANDYLVVSMDMPLSGEIVEASSEEPYLCLRLDFSPDQILDILEQTGMNKNSKRLTRTAHSVYVSTINDTTLLDAVWRLVQLLENPADIPFLSTQIIQEIFYRILQQEQGDILRQIVLSGSHAQRIYRSIETIKEQYSTSLKVDNLAKNVNMSPSSFYHYFKEFTGLSPIQYQKNVRLQRARQLMLTEGMSAAEAGFEVGYNSPSHFNREYVKLFGATPLKDIKKIQDENFEFYGA